MNWEAIGAIGEVLGALGVVVTLVFLAVQIRQNTGQLEENTRTLKTTALDETQRSWDHWRRHVIEDRSLAELWNRGLEDPKGLDQADALRFDSMVEEFLYVSMSTFKRAMAAGDQEHWRLTSAGIRQVVSMPGALDFWSRSRDHYYDDFAVEIDRLLADWSSAELPG
jgi:hypothetical protein